MFPRGSPLYRGVEQLAARRAHNPEVAGSSPAPATIAKTKSNDLVFLLYKNLGHEKYKTETKQKKQQFGAVFGLGTLFF